MLVMAHGLDTEVRQAELRQLHDYWLAKKGQRLAPARSDISPADMRKLLPHVFLLEVVGCPRRFKFRLAGTEVVERYGEELTGRFLDEIDLDEVGTEILGEYERATREAQRSVADGAIKSAMAIFCDTSG